MSLLDSVALVMARVNGPAKLTGFDFPDSGQELGWVELRHESGPIRTLPTRGPLTAHGLAQVYYAEKKRTGAPVSVACCRLSIDLLGVSRS